MRGKAMHRKFQSPADGITPAYAGKSHKPCSTTLQKRDHPRLCGEKNENGDTEFECSRITPAYAGKSW